VCECVLANRFDLLRVRSVLVAARQEHFVCGGFTHDVEVRVDSTLRIRAEPGAVEELVVDVAKAADERLTLGCDTLRLVCVAKATLIQPVDCLIVEKIIQTMTRLHCDKNLHCSSRKVKGLAQHLLYPSLCFSSCHQPHHFIERKRIPFDIIAFCTTGSGVFKGISESVIFAVNAMSKIG
jgi:hypothetical protein